MEKLDRLDWADGMAFTSYGLHVGVRVSDPAVLARVEEQLPFGWERSEDPEVEWLYSFVVGSEPDRKGIKRLHVVYSDAMVLQRTDDLELALKALERDVHLFVGEMARGHVFVHAGVVGWHGKAILLPGPTLSGKSTMTAALVRAGADYYSDEFAVLDAEGRVHPFARPLCLRPEGEFTGLPVAVEDLGGRRGTEPLEVGAILAAGYAPDQPWRPQRVTPGRAMLMLLANTLSARRDPEAVLPVLERVAQSAAAYTGRRGEASEIAESVLALVDSQVE